MRAQAREIVAELRRDRAAAVDPSEVEEAAALLDVARRRTTSPSSATASTSSSRRRRGPARARAGLRPRHPAPARRGKPRRRKLRASCRRASRATRARPRLLNLTKANSRATVHRPAYLDYIGVKRFDDDGKVVGERRFLGLCTTHRLPARARATIPVVRRKVEAVLRARRASRPAATTRRRCRDPRHLSARRAVPDHGGRALRRSRWASSRLGERQRVRLFVRRDELRALPLVPRVRAARPLQHAEPRARSRRSCARPSAPSSVDCELRLSESVLVRIHYIVAHRRRASCPTTTSTRSSARIVEATRSWTDDLRDGAARRARARSAATALFRRYGAASRRATARTGSPRSAVADIRRMEELRGGDGLGAQPLPPARGGRAARCAASCFRSRRAASSLSDVLPMFENMGLRGRRTSGRTRSRPRDGAPIWIYDFGLAYGADGRARRRRRVRERFQDAFARVWRGEVENDGFNALVLRAGLTWREVTVAARRRALPAPGRHDVQRPLHGADADAPIPTWRAALVELFRARFDPRPRAATSDADAVREPRSSRRSTRSRASTRTASCAASSPSVRAMLRTNHFQPDATARRSRSCRSSSTRRASRSCRCRARASRSSSTRRAWRACTCAAARSPAAGCAGRTAARTSAPRSSG